MSFSRAYQVNYGTGASALSGSATLTGDTETLLSFSVADATTNQEQQIGFDAAAIKAVVVTADGAITLKTNSSGIPAHTFTFPSGGGVLAWGSATPAEFANPFGTTDVTTSFWTNASGAAVAVEVRILLNS